MIFISYRREDTKEVVTHLERLLSERYGRDEVFVDYRDILPGMRWPDELRSNLEESRLVLAVIGKNWGKILAPEGDFEGLPRLLDPEDWVRQELCEAVRADKVIVVRIDGAALPKTKWQCELDRLAEVQWADLRSLKEFERDADELFRAIEGRGLGFVPRADTGSRPKTTAPADDHLRRLCLGLLRDLSRINLPLLSADGRALSAPLTEVAVDLPLLVSRERAKREDGPRAWLDHDLPAINDAVRATHTQAVLIDRAGRHQDIRREAGIGRYLVPGGRAVVAGDPGCGKTTMLRLAALKAADEGKWVPLLILCREWADVPAPAHFDELLRGHFRRRQFDDRRAGELSEYAEGLAASGGLLLLIDGLDEIPDRARREAFCGLLAGVAARHAALPVVVTSRVVGFRAVAGKLADFDHLLVGPLDDDAKAAFVLAYRPHLGLSESDADRVVDQVCRNRTTAKLTDNVLLLALVVQMHAGDRGVPARRVDVFRRAVRLMVERHRPVGGPPLTYNEVMAHLEVMAYRMRRAGVQYWGEADVLAAFADLRAREADEPALATRPPRDLLTALVESLGVLTVAGTEEDARGFERRVVQFFHQSFQEYFAGQAILHGRAALGRDDPPMTLQDVTTRLSLREREVALWGTFTVRETVVADHWQDALRLLIADMLPADADRAVRGLLPAPGITADEARARAVFALRCLLDEPAVGRGVEAEVFASVADHLIKEDGWATDSPTWMGEVLKAARGTQVGGRFLSSLIDAFIASRGERRMDTAGGVCVLLGTADGPIDEAAVADAERGLAGPTPAGRVRAALALMDRFYRSSRPDAVRLPADLHARTCDALLAAAETDEATAGAALWALMWVLGGKIQGHPPAPDAPSLTPDRLARLERVVRRPDADDVVYRCGLLSLSRGEGIATVFQQQDWVYNLAVVADGGVPRRALEPVRPVAGVPETAWMVPLLRSAAGLAAKKSVALALGRVGVFVGDALAALEATARDMAEGHVVRSEAMLYLGLTATPEAVRVLTGMADTPEADDEVLYSRGLFMLLLIDDAAVLAGQLAKALPHSDLNAYAYGLAGSCDPRGVELLLGLAKHADPRVRAAVSRGYDKAREWGTA